MGCNIGTTSKQMRQAKAEVQLQLKLEEQREENKAKRSHRCKGCIWGRDAGCGIVTCFWKVCIRGKL